MASLGIQLVLADGYVIHFCSLTTTLVIYVEQLVVCVYFTVCLHNDWTTC